MFVKDDQICVSVYCMAYNHEKYIRKTLEGFVYQKTNFNFEVIINDDASSDNTKAIIEEFAQKYPKIIKPIYQSENQYSKGIDMYKYLISPFINGEYIACCEGDDYWIDRFKLQRQYDYLNTHKECSLCVHDTLRINEDGSSTNTFFNGGIKACDYTTEDLIESPRNGIFHFSSMMFKKVLRDGFVYPYTIKGIGDFPLAVYLSLFGYVHYIPKVMSAYRQSSIGSWTSRNSDLQSKISVYNLIIEYLDRIDKITNQRFHQSILKQKQLSKYEIYVLNGNVLKIMNITLLLFIVNNKGINYLIKSLCKSCIIKLGLYDTLKNFM